MENNSAFLSKETENFNNALNLFFGMNPTNKYWILAALYFAKNRKLEAIDNYKGSGLILASISIDLIDNMPLYSEWQKAGIQNRTILAFASEEEKNLFTNLFNSQEEYESEELENQREASNNIFEIRQMEPGYLVEVAEVFMAISDDWYRVRGQWAFDAILRRTLPLNDKLIGMFYQPNELTSLVIKLLNTNNGTVYNPYAGLCPYGAELNSDCIYFGQEISHNYVLGQLKLLFNGKVNSICVRGDSLKEWKGANYDYIVATPPMKLECDSPYRYTDMDFLARASEDAKEKSIGVFSPWICYSAHSKSESPIIDIVDKDWLEYVISLPRNVFFNTSISPVIIVINKHKTNKGIVRLVDATMCFYIESKERKLLLSEIQALIETATKGNSVDVTNSEIRECGYVIAPEFYTNKKEIIVPEGFEIHKLSDFLSPLKPIKPSKNWGAIFSMDASYWDNVYLAKNLVKRPWVGGKYDIINEDCIIVSLRRHFEFAYLETDNLEVGINPYLYYPFSIDKSKLDPHYFLNEANKDYFINQLKRFSRNSFGRSLKISDFTKLKLLVPIDFSKQKSLALISREEEVEKLAAKHEAIFQRRMDDFILNQRQRKHAVAQVLNEILPSIENIESFIQSNQFVSKNSVVSQRFGTTLQQYLASVHTQLDKVISMVDNFTNSEKYGEGEVINLFRFLSEYSCQKKALDIDVEYIHKFEDEEIEQEVKISREDLTQMLDNLITNAIKYGTKVEGHQKYGSSDEKRKVRILIETSAIHNYNDPVVIKISNDGELVSKSISLDKLFVWGEGQGSGIGCWQVKDIAEHFGGTASYQEYPDDPEGFVCEFQIVLPLVSD